MEKLQYRIDEEPASANDIIKMARELDSEYDESSFYQTSVGAGILRKHGHKVDKNPDFVEIKNCLQCGEAGHSTCNKD